MTYRVGVDVGGTKILAVVLDDAGEIVAAERRLTPHVRDRTVGDTAARTIIDATSTALSSVQSELGDAVVGVGLPGMMRRDGVLAFAPNLKTANGGDLAQSLRDQVPGLRVVCENDADCAAVAEHRLGAARGVRDVVMVTLGTGIGGGLIVDGELVRGANGFAGEIGHMVVNPSGPRCPCGNRGCWERYASGAGVARLSQEAAAAGRLATIVHQVGGVEQVRGEDVTHAAHEGNAEALAVIDEVGWWLAVGIANLVAIIDCSLIVIGGGLWEASSLLVPAARRHLADLIEGREVRPVVEVVPAAFGDRAGAVGAALVAGERLL